MQIKGITCLFLILFYFGLCENYIQKDKLVKKSDKIKLGNKQKSSTNISNKRNLIFNDDFYEITSRVNNNRMKNSKEVEKIENLDQKIKRKKKLRASLNNNNTCYDSKGLVWEIEPLGQGNYFKQNSSNCSQWIEFYTDKFYESLDLIVVLNSSFILYSYYTKSFYQIFQNQALYGSRIDQINKFLYNGTWNKQSNFAPTDNKTNTFEKAFYDGEDLMSKIMNPEFNGGRPIESFGVQNSSTLWPNGVMYYDISFQFSSDHITIILESMEFIKNKTRGCLSFQKKNSSTEKWINIVDYQNGCWSYTGFVFNTGIQLLGLQINGCMKKGIIVHELIHAFGFNHEQCRQNRDQYITIFPENIIEGKKHNFNIMNGLTFDKPYDYYSILHYGSYAFSSNGQPSMIPKIPGVKLKEAFERTDDEIFSTYDILGIFKLYQCKNFPCSSNPCRNNGKCVDSIDFSTYKCICSLGLTGQNCEQNLNPCKPNPCKNFGKCTNSTDLTSYTCTCLLGFNGQNCSQILNPCLSSTCSRDQKCVSSDDFSTFTCL